MEGGALIIHQTADDGRVLSQRDLHGSCGGPGGQTVGGRVLVSPPAGGHPNPPTLPSVSAEHADAPGAELGSPLVPPPPVSPGGPGAAWGVGWGGGWGAPSSPPPQPSPSPSPSLPSPSGSFQASDQPSAHLPGWRGSSGRSLRDPVHLVPLLVESKQEGPRMWGLFVPGQAAGPRGEGSGARARPRL